MGEGKDEQINKGGSKVLYESLRAIAVQVEVVVQRLIIICEVAPEDKLR